MSNLLRELLLILYIKQLHHGNTYEDFPLPVGPRIAFIPGLNIQLKQTKTIRYPKEF